MIKTVPYDWIREVPHALLEHDSVPLFGHTPPFPWDAFQKSLNDLFQTQGFTLHPAAPQWRNAQELTLGIDNPTILHFNVEPMVGAVYWILSTEDISLLMSWLLAHTSAPMQTRQDPSLQEGFYQFLAVECCHLITTSPFDKSLTPKLIAPQSLPSDTSLCLDVGIGYKDQEIRGRLVLSNDFHRSWKEYYAKRNVSVVVPETLAQQVELTVCLEAGRVQLTQSEWNSLVPGDFIALDFCSIQPPENKGRVILVVNGIPLFRGKYKKGNLKILELPLFYEVDVPMTSSNHSNLEKPGEKNLEDASLIEENHTEEHSALEELHVEEASSEESIPDTSFTETGEASIDESESDEHPIETKKLNLDEIPLTLKVEVGRLQMSVKKLLELQSGNILELDVHPEDGVDLLVNGKCIGKGELIRVGEVLGVRLLDLIASG